MKHKLAFTEEQIKEIFERDNYCCLWCGNGEREGVEVHVEYLREPSEGNELTTDYGVVICDNTFAIYGELMCNGVA